MNDCDDSGPNGVAPSEDEVREAHAEFVEAKTNEFLTTWYKKQDMPARLWDAICENLSDRTSDWNTARIAEGEEALEVNVHSICQFLLVLVLGHFLSLFSDSFLRAWHACASLFCMYVVWCTCMRFAVFHA